MRDILWMIVLYIIGALAITLVYGCGDEHTTNTETKQCSVYKDESKGETTITCEDGTQAVVKDGKDGSDGSNGVDGTNGSDGIDGTNYVAPADMFGFWALPYGGYIELLKTTDEKALMNGTVRIYTSNFDGSLAMYPAFPVGPHYIRNGKVLVEFNVSYGVANGLAVDGTITPIAGSRKTVLTMSRINDKLSINIIVYGSSGLTVESNRTIMSDPN